MIVVPNPRALRKVASAPVLSHLNPPRPVQLQSKTEQLFHLDQTIVKPTITPLLRYVLTSPKLKRESMASLSSTAESSNIETRAVTPDCAASSLTMETTDFFGDSCPSERNLFVSILHDLPSWLIALPGALHSHDRRRGLRRSMMRFIKYRICMFTGDELMELGFQQVCYR
jgi:hypothetical protein